MRLGGRLGRIRPSEIARRVKAAYGHIVFVVKFRYRPRFLARYHGRQLRHVSGAAPVTGGKPIIAVVPYYGNAALLPSFLDHHRRIGVNFFVFLDLCLERPLSQDAKDIAIWRPKNRRSVKPVLHWLNYLRRLYATGRWCLSIDPSEFLVFPRYETRHIRDLIELLDNEGRDHFGAIVVETYGDKPAIETEAGANPLEALPYFDGIGYDSETIGRFRSVTTRGGVQRRTLYKLEPRQAPALNRIPLVKWRKKFCYIASTRLLTPRHLNTAHARWHLSPTGCLLRFALLDDGDVLALAGKVEAASLSRDKAAPSYPGLFTLREQLLTHPVSVRYETSQDLMDCGLMMPGQWF